ncbi:MAG TPA: hypothetical protein VHB21_00100 [Minicystis sp.]|nr:hypothetical protein [Minicystis sp.]
MRSSKRRFSLLGAFAFGAWLLLGALPHGELPAPTRRSAPPSADERAIEAREICVGSTVASAGELGPVLYYRHARDAEGALEVGYYAFYSEERPWGNNWLTWAVLPALGMDLVYTRGALVLPGYQRVAYGKGDVEGFRVTYDEAAGGALRARAAVADGGHHEEVELGARDLYAIDAARPTVYSSWWSHQLGGTGARAADLVSLRCYRGGAIQPLPDSIAREYNLDHRAQPARLARF